MLASVVEAAKANQVGLLKAQLAKEGAPTPQVIFKKKDEDGRSAFHWAFILESCGDEADQKKLLKFQDDIGRTPLMSATSAGHVDVVRFLLAAKADANQRTQKGQMALHYHKGNEAVLELLLPRTTNIDRADKYGGTALGRAVAGAKLEATELLLRAKANVHCVDAAGDTLLHIAASNKDDKMAKLLLAHGIDREVLNKDGKKAEHLRGAR